MNDQPPWDPDHDPFIDDEDPDTDTYPAPPASARRLYPVPDAAGFTTDDDPAAATGPLTAPAAAAGSLTAPAAPAPWGHTNEELLNAALEQLDLLGRRVGELDELITADRQDENGTGAGKHLRFRYERHPEADASAAHAELARWVSWLVATYQLTDAVPPCWDRHDALAEELAGFYVAWQNIWADEGRYDAAVLWHDQLHRAATARWAGWLRGTRCTQSCALDVEFVDQAHQQWTEQAAAASGGQWRLTRTRTLAPPIPVPIKKPPGAGKTTGPGAAKSRIAGRKTT